MFPATSLRRAMLAGLLAALSLALGLRALSVRVDPGVESLIPASEDGLGRLDELHALFGPDESIILAVSADPLFDQRGLEALRDLTREAASLPGAGRVLSPVNVRDLDADELGPLPVVPYERVLAGEMTPEALGRRLAAHPVFGGLLVAADARTAAVLIEVSEGAGDADTRADLVAGARRIIAGLPDGMIGHVAGLPVEKADVAAFVLRDQRIFAPLIFGMLALAMAVLFRYPAGVVIPMSVVALALVWTLGLYQLAGGALNPVTSLVTPVVLVVSVEGAIHLLNYHRSALAAGRSKGEAIRGALSLARVPCFNAALTTAFGFGSLLLVPIPAIRAFGLAAAAGVMISWVLAMTLAPLLLFWLPPPPARLVSGRRGRAESLLRATAIAVWRHPIAAAGISIIVLGVSAAGLTRLRVETDLLGSLRHDSDLSRATRFIDERLTGVNALEILVPVAAPDDAEEVRRVEQLERAIEKMDGVRNVTGLIDLYARANRAFHGGDDAMQRLPAGPGAAQDLADMRALLEQEAPVEMARFASRDAGGVWVLRLTARVTAMDTRASQELFDRIRAAAAAADLPGVTLTGNFAVLSDMSTTLVRNQMRSVLPALALILLAMSVQFRSARLGLLCIIPNGAPLLMVYGVMGWTGIALSVPTAMIAGIAIGMTVDHSIHLMARFREEFGRSRDYLSALESMLDASGRAIVTSTLALVAGFWVGAFSSFLPSVHFVLLTGMALLLGLLSAAVLLPLMLAVFRPLGPQGATVPAAAVALLALLAAGGAAPGAAAPILLKDQFGKVDAPDRHRGRVVLLLFGEAAGLRRMKTWELRLLEQGNGEIDVVRVVDARPVKGKKTETEVNERLRRNVPPDIPILVDWDGTVAGAYHIPDAEVTATILDPQGRSCGTFAGPAEPPLLARARELLTRVKYKGVCP